MEVVLSDFSSPLSLWMAVLSTGRSVPLKKKHSKSLRLPLELMKLSNATTLPSRLGYGTWLVWLPLLCGPVLSVVWCSSHLTCSAFFGTLYSLELKINISFSVEEDIEIRGLDIKKHGEPAYPTAAYGHGWDAEGDFRMSSKYFFFLTINS